MDLLKDLNEQQKMAVVNTKGPILVIAGAGAGKTKVITHRTAYLIQKGIKPENILAVTFTNKAANEMKQRIKNLLAAGEDPFSEKKSPSVGTFHSIGARILRENTGKTDRTKNFSIVDEEDVLKTLRTCLRELNIVMMPALPGQGRGIDLTGYVGYINTIYSHNGGGNAGHNQETRQEVKIFHGLRAGSAQPC